MMNRRTLLTAAPLAALASGIGVASVLPGNDDHLLYWVELWEEAYQYRCDLYDHPGGENGELPVQEKASAFCDRLGEDIGAAKPTTAKGVAAQLRWSEMNSHDFQLIDDDTIAALQNATRALEALAA